MVLSFDLFWGVYVLKEKEPNNINRERREIEGFDYKRRQTLRSRVRAYS